MNKTTTESTTDTASPTPAPTPYIAVAANYFGTGKSAQEARKNLVKAGGSPQEEQTVFKLPDGATNAFVADTGSVHWYGVEGEMRPVFHYKAGKAIAWAAGEDAPVAYKKPTAKTKPIHSPDAQMKGDIHPEPELSGDGAPDKESTIASTDLKPVKAKKPAKKPAPVLAGESIAADDKPPVAAKPSKKPAKPAPVTQDAAPTSPVGDAQPTLADAAPVKPSKKAGSPVTEAVAKSVKPKAAEAKVQTIEAADFMLFVGGSFYTKDTFIEEAKTLGISRRMPSHRLPKGLVCGKSRVYLASEGVRKTDGTPSSEVFGYFTPSAVHFIANGKTQEYADVIAALKLRKDSKIINSVKNEPERACGTRQEGGTYIVVDKADSPLVLLDKPAHYEGNHFRGMLRLNDIQARTFNTGGVITTLVDEHCMKCGDAMKCAPDGHARADRERKRIEKGQPVKWMLLDGKCQKELRAQRAADDGPQSVEDVEGSVEDPSQGTD